MPPFLSFPNPTHAKPTLQSPDIPALPHSFGQRVACGALRQQAKATGSFSGSSSVSSPCLPLPHTNGPDIHACVHQDAADHVAQAIAAIYRARPLAFIDDFDQRRAIEAVAIGAPAYLYSAGDANVSEASRLAVAAMDRGLATAISEWGEDGYGAACGYCVRHLVPLNAPARVELALWIYDAIEIRLVDAPKNTASPKIPRPQKYRVHVPDARECRRCAGMAPCGQQLYMRTNHDHCI